MQGLFRKMGVRNVHVLDLEWLSAPRVPRAARTLFHLNTGLMTRQGLPHRKVAVAWEADINGIEKKKKNCHPISVVVSLRIV
jgi:hypothetical protein